MNLTVLAMAAAMSWIFGVARYVILQTIVLSVAGTGGVWLFYIQHQFEDVYWARGEDWDYTAAALRGSSFYKLPRVLQWFSGNIGFHHIHHLSPRIPNYNLEACHRSDPLFRDVKPMTLVSSLRSFPLRLWDESAKRAGRLSAPARPPQATRTERKQRRPPYRLTHVRRRARKVSRRAPSTIDTEVGRWSDSPTSLPTRSAVPSYLRHGDLDCGAGGHGCEPA